MENKALVLDLVEWVSAAPRRYDELMDAWQTSCPRLTVWEDAERAGYVTRRFGADGELQVAATPSGRRFLQTHGRAAAPVAPAPAPAAEHAG